jgi:hypothetical protein
MIGSKLILALAAILVGSCALLAAVDGAAAKPKTQATGTFDCSCTGGSGTCSFTTSGPIMKCTKGGSDTCTGACTLKTTPTGAGGAAALKGGAAKSSGKLKAQ